MDSAPIRKLTHGPWHHWRGYYDKLLTDPTDRFVVANQVGFEHRSPRPDDVLKVGLVDMGDHDRWTELGSTRAWNWQQGCMLQWLPGSDHEVIWNDREGDQFVAHILNTASGARRTIAHPIYCVSPDGKLAMAPDFRRLNDTRPGYGYCGVPDPHRDVAAPEDSGLFRIDLTTGEQRLVFSFADAARIPQPGGFPPGTKHWFNHLLFSPNGVRLVFLHRWRKPGEAGWSTRMFSIDPDGSDPFVLMPSGKVSHFVWRDADRVTAYAGYPPQNDWHFCVYRDKTTEVETFGDGILKGDGHVTYIAGTHDEWALNDTYPDGQRLQHLHKFHLPTRRRVDLAALASPKAYAGEWRCDLHPLSSRNGRFALIDSVHEGDGRQVYRVELGG